MLRAGQCLALLARQLSRRCRQQQLALPSSAEASWPKATLRPPRPLQLARGLHQQQQPGEWASCAVPPARRSSTAAAAGLPATAAACGEPCSSSAFREVSQNQQQQQEQDECLEGGLSPQHSSSKWLRKLLTCAKDCRHNPTPLHEVEGLLQHALQPGVLQQLPPRKMADLMWAAGNLQAPACRGRYTALRRHCIAVLHAAADVCCADGDSHGVSSSACGGTDAGGRMSVLQRMNPFSLISVLDGCARALPTGHQLPPQFLSSLADALRDVAAGADSSSGASISSNAAARKASSTAGDSSNPSASTASNAVARTSSTNAAAAAMQTSAITPAAAGARLKARHWSQAVWSCAVLRWSEAPVLPLAVAFVSRLADRDVGAWEVANVVWGLGTLADVASPAQRHQWEQPLWQQQQVVQQLLAAFSSRMVSGATPQALSNVLLGVAKLALPCADAQLQVSLPRLLAALLRQLPHAQPQDVSNSLWALAVLVERGDDGVRAAVQGPRLLPDLLSALSYLLADATPQAVSNTLWALAVLGEHGVDVRAALQGQRLAELLHAFQDGLSRANSQDVSNTLWALAYLDEYREEVDSAQEQQLLRELLAAFQRNLPGAKLQEASNMLWALACLAKRGADVQPVMDGPLLQQLLAALLDKLQQATPQDVSNTVWALSTLDKHGVAVQHALGGRLPLLLAALQERLPHANAQDVSNTLWALYGFAERGMDVRAAMPPGMLPELLAALHADLPGATPQALFNTVFAMAQLSNHGVAEVQQLHPERLQQAVAAFASRLPYMGMRTVINTLWALSVLRVRPDKPLAEELLRSALRQRNDQHTQLSVRSVARLLLGCAELRLPLQGYPNTQPWNLALLHKLVHQSLCSADQAAENLSATAYAIVTALCTRPRELAAARPVVQLLVSAAADAPAPQNPVTLHQLFHAHLAYSLLADCDSLLPTHLLPICERAWRDHALATASTLPCSDFQAAVFAVAQQLQQQGSHHCFQHDSVRRGPDALVGDGLFVADVVAVSRWAGRQIVIQTNGPLHSMRNCPGFETGSAVLRSCLLRSLPAEPPFSQPPLFVDVPYSEWERQRSAADRQLYLYGLIAPALA